MKALLSILVLIGVVAYAAFLAHGNSDRLSINLLFTVFDGVPLWLALLGAAVLGAVVTGVACAWPMLRLRLNLRRQSRRITRLEQEIHGLRTLPLEEEEEASARDG